MKAITIRQPFASLIAENIKLVEIRSWNTKFRGPLYIHAGLGVDREYLPKYKDVIDVNNMPKGQIIAKCEMVDCVLLDKEYIDNYNAEYGDRCYKIRYDCIGYYGFILDNIEKLDKPIEAKGKLSFWEVG